MHLHGMLGIQYSVLSLHSARSLLILVIRVCSTKGRLMTLSTYSLSGTSLSWLLLVLPILPKDLRKLPPPVFALFMTFLLPDLKPPLSLSLVDGLSVAKFSSLPLAMACSVDLPRLELLLALRNRILSDPCHSESSGAVFGARSKDCFSLGLFAFESWRIVLARASGLRNPFSLLFMLRLSSLGCGDGCGLVSAKRLLPTSQSCVS